MDGCETMQRIAKLILEAKKKDREASELLAQADALLGEIYIGD